MNAVAQSAAGSATTTGPVAMTATACSPGKIKCPGKPPLLTGSIPDYPRVAIQPSSGGKLIAALNAAPASPDVNMPGFPLPQNMYNQTVIPPALYVSRQDSIDLTLTSKMDFSNPYYAKRNQSTNLHYHGFNIAPGNFPTQQAIDSVYLSVDAKKPTYEFKFQIPATHPMGSFWYHPHPHGVSEPQLLGGMSGLIVVRGLIENYYPGVMREIGAYIDDNTKGIQQRDQTVERVFLLKDYVPQGGNGCAVKAVNGSVQGNISVSGSRPQLWRFANAGADQFYNLQVVGSDQKPVPYYVLAVDGNVATTPQCTPQNADNITACPIVTNTLTLAPGSRMDVLVQFQPGQSYTLMDVGTNTGPAGDPNCPVSLGTVTVKTGPSGSAIASLFADKVTTDRRTKRWFQNNWPKCKSTSGAKPQTVKFGVSKNRKGFSVLPNGGEFDMNTVNYTVTNAPCVDEWTITNDSDHRQQLETHVFHIHQLDYYVESITPASADRGVFNASPGFQDTLTVPFKGKATVLIPFDDDIAGYFVYHCHILNHEDQGMMANICVQGSGKADPQCTTKTPAAGATAHGSHR